MAGYFRRWAHMRRTVLPIPTLLFASFMAMAAGSTTPEGALRDLENAYVRKDLEAAVAAKDFNFEARAMLKALRNIGDPDQAIVKQAAEVLELGFRRQMQTSGLPAFADLRCRVVSKKALSLELVEMVEECIFPDGGRSTDTVHAAKSSSGWRIVVLP